MPPQQYRKRVEVVQAIEYIGTNKSEVLAFAPGVVTENADGSLQFTSSGMSSVLPVGYWILKDMSGAYLSFSADFPDYYQPGGQPA